MNETTVVKSLLDPGGMPKFDDPFNMKDFMGVVEDTNPRLTPAAAVFADMYWVYIQFVLDHSDVFTSTAIAHALMAEWQEQSVIGGFVEQAECGSFKERISPVAAKLAEAAQRMY